MQTFCRQQLKRELTSAIHALESSDLGDDKSTLGELVPEL
jgi:hypothetical protein